MVESFIKVAVQNSSMKNKEAVEAFVADLSLRGYSDNTVKAYRLTIESALKHSRKHFKEVTTADLKQFLLHLQKEKGCSLKTINRHANALRSFFRNHELNTAEKIYLPRVEKTLPTFLNQGETERLLSCISNVRDLLIIRFLYASGLRVSELVNLNKEDLEGNTVRVHSGKGKKDRVTYVDDGTLQLVGEYLKGRKDDNSALFINRRGKRLSERHIETIVKKCAVKAGIKKKVTPHTMRHTFATHLLQNNANIVVIQNLLGHASLATTQIYTHVTDEHKKNVYENSHPLSKK